MQPADLTDAGIYPRILGDRWQEVAETVRKMHTAPLQGPVHGRFQVAHGTGRIVRLIARLMRLPVEAEQTDITLSVISKPDGEVWHRIFDRVHLITFQQAGPNGIMKESMGLLELRFRVEVVDGALHYRQTAAGIPIGAAFIPLPRLLRPIVAAQEAPGDQNDRTSIHVSISLPVLGPLLTYRGYLALPEHSS